MIQTTVERGITCLQRLLAKTRRLCFLEMGYSAEPQYKEALKVNIDRAWVRQIMEEEGGFSEVRMFDAQEHGLMFGRDFFVGIKDAAAVLPRDANASGESIYQTAMELLARGYLTIAQVRQFTRDISKTNPSFPSR